MYATGPEPMRSATDPTPFARPSARASAPTSTMQAKAIAQAVIRVRRVKRVARRRIGRAISWRDGRGSHKRSAVARGAVGRVW